MEKLKQLKLYLLDMDGTIYLDNDLFDGSVDFLKYVKNIGGRYIFLTNNSSKSVNKYIEKLNRMGIASDKNDFLTSADLTVVCLKKGNYKKIYALGTESFKEQLRASGLNITDELSENIDCLCMGYDTELSYKNLEDAYNRMSDVQKQKINEKANKLGEDIKNYPIFQDWMDDYYNE